MGNCFSRISINLKRANGSNRGINRNTTNKVLVYLHGKERQINLFQQFSLIKGKIYAKKRKILPGNGAAEAPSCL